MLKSSSTIGRDKLFNQIFVLILILCHVMQLEWCLMEDAFSKIKCNAYTCQMLLDS